MVVGRGSRLWACPGFSFGPLEVGAREEIVTKAVGMAHQADRCMNLVYS